MLELPKGGNTAVVGPVIRSTLQTRLAPGEIDICALLVDEQRRVRCDEDFVFFNRERSRCGSTRRLSDVEIEVDLRHVPATVDAIVIAASLDDTVTGSVASHGGGAIAVADAASTITHTLAGLTTERCVIVAELYRRAAGWKLRAISQGFPDLARLIAVFGVNTSSDVPSGTTRPAPPASSPTTTARPPRSSAPVPPETQEIIDRVRAGAAARRASLSSPFPLPSWRPRRPRRGATPAQQRAEYKAERHREAAHITAGIEQQNRQVEAILHRLPHNDLSTNALLGLIDASAPQPAPPRLRLFRRSEPAPPPVPPSSYLEPGLHRLRQAAGRPHNRDAVHAWLWLAIHATDLQPSFGHTEHISVASDGQKVVIDVSLPDRASVIPLNSRVRYRPGTDAFDFTPATPKDLARLAEILFSASLLAHAHTLASAMHAAGLPRTLPLVLNGWEAIRSPITGHTEQVCRATLVTTSQDLATIDLHGVHPPTCLRSLAGSVEEARRVTPIATRTGSTPAGRQLDLTAIDPFNFERLITELAQAMGYIAYQTPRSGDHGVDVFVESRDTLASGRIVISAKRYNSTVGPDHVRALDSVVGDQGAIKGILITTSGFGPESYRVAQDKPLELVDGQKLRQWLHEYLGVASR